MPECGMNDIADVIGGYEFPPTHGSQRLTRQQQCDSRPWTRAPKDRRQVASTSHNLDQIVLDSRLDLCSLDLAATELYRSAFQPFQIDFIQPVRVEAGLPVGNDLTLFIQ